MFDRQRRAAGDVQDRGHEQRRAALALPEQGHQRGREGDQAGAGLAGRDTRWQLRTGRFAAVAAGQAMLLVLGDERFDLRELPHLMTERGRDRRRPGSSRNVDTGRA